MLAQLVESRTCPPRRLSTSALNALRHRPWAGNLAELEWAVKNMAMSGLDEELQLADVERVFAGDAGPAPSVDLPLDGPYREARDAFERLYFERLLEQEHGSMSRVADRSGLERTHLYRKLKALGVALGRREDG
jgi:DNA-binding NtrC family response regulator